METRSNPKSKGHSKSHSPSKLPPTKGIIPNLKVIQRVILPSKSPNPRSEVVQTSTKSPSTLPLSFGQTFAQVLAKPPEVQNFIQSLEGISISREKYVQTNLSEGIVTSYLQYFSVLTRSQSEKVGIKPFDFPLPTHRKKKSTPKTQSSASEITSSSPPHTHFVGPASSLPPLPSSYHPLIPSFHIS